MIPGINKLLTSEILPIRDRNELTIRYSGVKQPFTLQFTNKMDSHVIQNDTNLDIDKLQFSSKLIQ